MGGLLQLVDHGHGVVLYGDVAGVGLRVDDEVVLAEAELARARAFLVECAGRRDHRRFGNGTLSSTRTQQPGGRCDYGGSFGKLA